MKTLILHHYLISTLDGLERSKNVSPLSSWEQVLKQDKRNTFFQGPVWTGEWYTAYREAFDPLVVVVTCDDKLVGVVPLAVEKGTRRLAFAGDQMADYRDILSAPSSRPEVVRALLQVFRDGHFPNMLRIGPMLPESDTADLILSMARQEGLWGIRRSHYGWRWWPAEATEDPLKSRSIRYKLNYFRRRGEVKAEVVTSPRDWHSFNGLFYGQHSLRQLYAGRKTSFDNPMKRAFFERLYETNLAHVTLLRVADHIIAGHYGCIWDGVLYWGAPSFDVRESAYSPGLLLLVLTMKSAAEWGLRGIDLTIGEGNLKERSSTSRVELPSVDLYSRQISWGKQRVVDMMVVAVRRLLERAGTGGLWASRIRPALVGVADNLHKAKHAGFLRGLRWLWVAALRPVWHTTRTTVLSVEAAQFLPTVGGRGEARKEQVYDLLLWRGDDPFTAVALTNVARKLPDALKNGLVFHTLVIDGRLAAWGFSFRAESSDGRPSPVQLSDFEALPEYLGCGAIGTLLSTVAVEYMDQRLSSLILQATDAPPRALAVFRRLGFRPVETVIETRRLGISAKRIMNFVTT